MTRIVTDDFRVSWVSCRFYPHLFPFHSTLAQILPPLPTLWPLPTSPLDWYNNYGIGLFWCKEDQNVFLTADTLLTAASLSSQETSGCGGPSICVYKSYSPL